MSNKAFSDMVARVVVATCVMIVVLGLTFQATSADLRHDHVAFSTVVESRKIWLGECGVLLLLPLVVLLGSLSIAVHRLSIQFNVAYHGIFQSLGAILLRVSLIADGLVRFFPQSKS